jgi:hypothetical protein
MDVVKIIDPGDPRFPFGKELWADPHVVYHGTWSAFSARIEADGFGHPELPFDDEDIASIMRARQAIGWGSYAPTFFGDNPGPRQELSMTGNFWHARAYSTDGGGEVIRITIKEALEFEALCTSDEKRIALINSWKKALKAEPGHYLTVKAVGVLEDQDAMQALCNTVRTARTAIEKVTKGGFPVVYALRVEPEWFPERWERYMFNWTEGKRAAVELRCRRDLLCNDRILAKAIYPNGTDPDFMLDGHKTWADVPVHFPKANEERT